MTTYNIELIDRAGRSVKVRGVPDDGVKNAKETLRTRALEEGLEPPFYYSTHQMEERKRRVKR